MANASDSEPEEQRTIPVGDEPMSDVESDDEVLSKLDTTKALSINKMLQLPVSRIKTIMKSSPELANVKPESYILITRATELFVAYLAKRAYETSGDDKTIEYKALSTVVSKDECLDFLEEIVPFKITMKDYWEKYGYPKEEDEIEIVEIESNGSSSNGSLHKSSSNVVNSVLSATPQPTNSLNSSLKTPNSTKSTPNSTSGKSLKSANSVNSSKTPKSGKSVPNKTPKSSNTIKNSLNKSDGTPIVNGIQTPSTPSTPHVPVTKQKIPEVICIDD